MAVSPPDWSLLEIDTIPVELDTLYVLPIAPVSGVLNDTWTFRFEWGNGQSSFSGSVVLSGSDQFMMTEVAHPTLGDMYKVDIRRVSGNVVTQDLEYFEPPGGGASLTQEFRLTNLYGTFVGGGEEPAPSEPFDFTSVSPTLLLTGANLVGNPASAWTNIGSAGGSFSQVTVAGQPVIGSIDSVAAASFDGNDDRFTSFMVASTVLSADAWTVFMILDPVDAASSGFSTSIYNNDCIMGDTNGYWGIFATSETDGPGYRLQVLQFNSTADHADSDVLTFGTPHILQASYNGISQIMRLRIDNGPVFEVTSVAPPGDISSNLSIGYNGYGQYYDGALSFVLAKDTLMTGAEVLAVRDGLQIEYPNIAIDEAPPSEVQGFAAFDPVVFLDNTTLSGGSDIDVWTNIGSVGGAFTQGDTALQPIRGAVDGVDSVFFNGTSDAMGSTFNLGDVISSGSWTMFLVIDPLVVNGVSSDAMANDTVISDTDGWWGVFLKSAGSGTYTVDSVFYTSLDVEAKASSVAAFSVGTPQLIQVIYNDATSTMSLRVGSGAVIETTGLTGLHPEAFAASLSIGKRLSGLNYYNGDTAFIFSKMEAMSSSDITSVRALISAKYPTLDV